MLHVGSLSPSFSAAGGVSSNFVDFAALHASPSTKVSLAEVFGSGVVL